MNHASRWPDCFALVAIGCALGIIKPISALRKRMARPGKISRYLQSTDTPVLILGAGSQLREGWLVSDLDPVNEAIITIDATRKLPFPDPSLD